MLRYTSIIPEFEMGRCTWEQLNQHYQEVRSKAREKLNTLGTEASINSDLQTKLNHAKHLLNKLEARTQNDFNERQLKLLISTVSYATRVMVYGTSADQDVSLLQLSIEEIQEKFGFEYRPNQQCFIKNIWEPVKNGQTYVETIKIYQEGIWGKISSPVNLIDYNLEVENANYYLNSCQNEEQYYENARQLGLCALELTKAGYGHAEKAWLKTAAIIAFKLSVIAIGIHEMLLSANPETITSRAIATAFGVDAASINDASLRIVLGGTDVSVYGRFYTKASTVEKTRSIPPAEKKVTLSISNA